MGWDLEGLKTSSLIELKMDVEKEIAKRRKKNLESLVNDFKNAFLDVADYMDVKFSDASETFWVYFSDLSFFDKETGEEINI